MRAKHHQQNRISRRHSSTTAGNGASLRHEAETLGRDVRHFMETAGESALELARPADTYIREKPLKSVLIAAGVGAVLGILLARR